MLVCNRTICTMAITQFFRSIDSKDQMVMPYGKIPAKHQSDSSAYDSWRKKLIYESEKEAIHFDIDMELEMRILLQLLSACQTVTNFCVDSPREVTNKIDELENESENNLQFATDGKADVNFFNKLQPEYGHDPEQAQRTKYAEEFGSQLKKYLGENSTNTLPTTTLELSSNTPGNKNVDTETPQVLKEEGHQDWGQFGNQKGE
ncbi:hypothetical protein Tco_0115956 [Tanacetum coccineum]